MSAVPIGKHAVSWESFLVFELRDAGIESKS